MSCLVTYHLFVAPALRTLAGRDPRPTLVRVRAAEELRLDPRPEYHRAVLARDTEGPPCLLVALLAPLCLLASAIPISTLLDCPSFSSSTPFPHHHRNMHSVGDQQTACP